MTERAYGVVNLLKSSSVLIVLICCRMYAPASIFALFTACLMSRGSVEEASQIICGRFALRDLFSKAMYDFAFASSSI